MALGKVWIAAALLLAGVPSASLADEQIGNFAQPGDPPGPQYGGTAPTFRLRAYNEDVAVKLVNSADVSVNNFVGIAPEVPKKSVVVHFFSLKHAASTKDLVMLQRLYKKYADDGLMVICINIDSDEPEKVYGAMDDSRVAFPVLKDRFGIVARRYGLKTLPTLYVLGPEGNVVSVREGYVSDVSEVLEGEVKALLN